MLAAAVRLDAEPHRRVCLMQSSVRSGCPATAIVVEPVDVRSGDVSESEAVCRICVCGMETVMIIRRGGYGEGGAVPGIGDLRSGDDGRKMDL